MERAYSRESDASDEPTSETAHTSPPNWVDELIAMTRPGVEIEFPSRTLAGRVIPFEYDDFS